MRYEKPPKSIEQQVALLVERGLCGNPATIAKRLRTVNYYRLSGYWYPFRQPNDLFRPGTHIDEVWSRYMFDRKLRLVLLDAIERIEVSVRTKIAYLHAIEFGPFGYADDSAALREQAETVTRAQFLERVQQDTSKSHEEFMRHFRKKYGDVHAMPPIWIAAEVMSMGTLVSLFKLCPPSTQNAVAREYEVPVKVFATWLLALNAARNICAHHGRLWNRQLGVKPMIPREFTHPQWHSPSSIANNRVFALLSICRHCLKMIAPKSGWSMRVTNLLDNAPDIPKHAMGIPHNWKEHSLWSAT